MLNYILLIALRLKKERWTISKYLSFIFGYYYGYRRESYFRFIHSFAQIIPLSRS